MCNPIVPLRVSDSNMVQIGQDRNWSNLWVVLVAATMGGGLTIYASRANHVATTEFAETVTIFSGGLIGLNKLIEGLRKHIATSLYDLTCRVVHCLAITSETKASNCCPYIFIHQIKTNKPALFHSSK